MEMNKTEFIKITDIYEDNSEDTYAKYNFVVNAIDTEVSKYKKEERENEKLAKLSKRVQEKTEEDYTSHADDNEGVDIY